MEAEGWLPGPLPTSAHEVPESSSALDLTELPEGARPEGQENLLKRQCEHVQAPILPFRSMGVLSAHQTVGLLAVMMHGNMLLRGVVLEGDSQHVACQLSIHPVVSKDHLNLAMDQGLQGLEEYWVVLKVVQPAWGLDVIHRMLGCSIVNPPLGYLTLKEVMSSLVSQSSSSLVHN